MRLPSWIRAAKSGPDLAVRIQDGDLIMNSDFSSAIQLPACRLVHNCFFGYWSIMLSLSLAEQKDFFGG